MNITSLEQLEEWNMNNFGPPNRAKGEEEIFVMDWYYEWMFDEVLPKKDYEYFKRAHDVMTSFTAKYEEILIPEARLRTFQNLKYWHSRASKDDKPFIEYFNKLLLYYFGYNEKPKRFSLFH